MQSLHAIAGISTATLADYLSLVETRSFQTTAERQHISQPALSRRIQTLEEAVGAKLFDRRNQPITLTRAGSALLPFIKEALGRLTEGLEAFRSVSTGLYDPIRIVATHTAAITALPIWLKNTKLDLSTDQILLNSFRTERCLAELKAGRADLGLCMWPKGEALPQELQSVVIATDYLAAIRSASITKNNERSLLSFAPGGALGEAVQKNLAKISSKTKLQPVFESPSSEVLLAMVRGGFGTAYIPEKLIIKEHGLRKLPWPKIAVEMRIFQGAVEPTPRITQLWQLSCALSPL